MKETQLYKAINLSDLRCILLTFDEYRKQNIIQDEEEIQVFAKSVFNRIPTLKEVSQ